jgi:hypothetical protein
MANRNQDNQPREKKNRQVKFGDVLAMYKLIKDIYARIDDIERRLNSMEKNVSTKPFASETGAKI